MAQNLQSKSKYEALLHESVELDRQIAEFAARGVTTDLGPQMQALHAYNDMKDIAQVVLGFLANVRQVTVSELHNRYNLPLE